MPLNWINNITTRLRGARFGLQVMTTGQSGGSRGPNEFLVGPDAFRGLVSTASSTSANIRAHGQHLLAASSAGSSQVYTLDPPIPGVTVTLYNSTDATAYIKTANTETIKSTVGSTQHVVAMPAAGAMIRLTAISTARWVTETTTASGINLTNTT